MAQAIKNALRSVVQRVGRAGAYVSARASEGSTWAGISVAIAGASALAAPYSYLFIGVGVIGVFAKTTKTDKAGESE